MKVEDLVTGTKQVLDRGYVTNMLTDGDRKIFGQIKDCYINVWKYESKCFYWSEVYVEPGYLARIIRKGMLLVDPSDNELSQLHAQSKINFGL